MRVGPALKSRWLMVRLPLVSFVERRVRSTAPYPTFPIWAEPGTDPGSSLGTIVTKRPPPASSAQ